MTSASRDVQLTNHRRQLSADSASSLQCSLLLANADDVELNRLSGGVSACAQLPSVTSDSKAAGVNNDDDDDVDLLELEPQSSPSHHHHRQSSSVDDVDEPLLSNAFNTHR